MVVNIMEIILTIKKKELAFLYGVMAENMQETGKMVNNMVLGFIVIWMARD